MTNITNLAADRYAMLRMIGIPLFAISRQIPVGKWGGENTIACICNGDNFVVDNIGVMKSVEMLIGYRAIKSKYLSIPQNFRPDNIHLDNTNRVWKLHRI
ncbi:hypothetical protein [Escherichia albertii]|uniref:hypothetical protein n=1 Tax=Escherichia albertii TaxID=208962 RepID=UPI000CF65DE0|nr:hypothetical protein [Escherichia albertii]